MISTVPSYYKRFNTGNGEILSLCRLLSAAFPGNTFSSNPVFGNVALENIWLTDPQRSEWCFLRLWRRSRPPHSIVVVAADLSPSVIHSSLGAYLYDVRSRWGEGGPQKADKMRLRDSVRDKGREAKGAKNPNILRTSYKYRPFLLLLWTLELDGSTERPPLIVEDDLDWTSAPSTSCSFFDDSSWTGFPAAGCKNTNGFLFAGNIVFFIRFEFDLSLTLRRFSPYTGRMGWMAHRKWKEIRLQPSMLPGPAVPGSCLASFHFRWDIHPIRPVYLGRHVETGNSFTVCSQKNSVYIFFIIETEPY